MLERVQQGNLHAYFVFQVEACVEQLEVLGGKPRWFFSLADALLGGLGPDPDGELLPR